MLVDSLFTDVSKVNLLNAVSKVNIVNHKGVMKEHNNWVK
jgi:hypothetical protein